MTYDFLRYINTLTYLLTYLLTRPYCIETAKRIELVFSPPTYTALYFKESRLFPKLSILPSGTLSRTLDFITKFGRGVSTVSEFDKQATVVGLSLTTFGDDGRG